MCETAFLGHFLTSDKQKQLPWPLETGVSTRGTFLLKCGRINTKKETIVIPFFHKELPRSQSGKPVVKFRPVKDDGSIEYDLKWDLFFPFRIRPGSEVVLKEGEIEFLLVEFDPPCVLVKGQRSSTEI